MKPVLAKKPGQAKKPTEKVPNKDGSVGNYGKSRVSKPKKQQQLKKRKSIHANTFEERQVNRQKKEDFQTKKLQRKEHKIYAKERTLNLISNVSAWVKDNPIHPSITAAPTQEGLEDKSATLIKRTFKAFVRNLPKDVTPEEIDEHFYKRGVNIHCIRVFHHRKTGECLGWCFLEFTNRIEFDKALTLNVSRFRDDRILVEANVSGFIPSKRKPQKVVSYKPPTRTPAEPEPEKEQDENMEVEIIERK